MLLEDNLIVNESKTEETTLERKIKVPYRCKKTQGINLKIIKQDCKERWRTVKKLGSFLGDVEDLRRRKQLAIVAMKKFSNIWIANSESQVIQVLRQANSSLQLCHLVINKERRRKFKLFS